MVKVLIQDGLVHEIFGTSSPDLHKDLLVVDAPDDVENGYVYDNGAFTAPIIVGPTYVELRAAEYGTTTEQIEFITENGLEAWQDKANEIKLKYPKGV